MALLDVQHVKKIYKTRFKGNQVEALKDIHFTVDKGDYVAIMGVSILMVWTQQPLKIRMLPVFVVKN